MKYLFALGLAVTVFALAMQSTAPARGAAPAVAAAAAHAPFTGVAAETAAMLQVQEGGQDDVPMDPEVRTGTLANGLRFYVRENSQPEHRAELRLVVNAGSILEDDDQAGLAHFAEHIAFNGTRRFERQALVDYLESIGMRFGPDVNAYTGFDETVYMLTVPTDSAVFLEQAFRILEDWAGAVTFESEEIDKERGVVIEEWRLRRGANARMMEREFPLLLRGSHYAERLPIGTHESLQHFSHEALVRFYRDWYRPDLMAVIAVGDFDADVVETLIRNHFSGLEAPVEPRERPAFAVPDHQEPLASLSRDAEASGSTVRLYMKRPVRDPSTVKSFRQEIIDGLYSGMLSRRLSELARSEGAPFLYANAYHDRLVRTKEAYVLEAGVNDGGILPGLESLLLEVERAAQHGFTASELDRQKRFVSRLVERNYRERDRTESAAYASQYVSHFLSGYPAPGPEQTFALYDSLMPGITLEDVNQLAAAALSEENRVLLVRTPEDALAPTEEELLDLHRQVVGMDLAPYEDVTDDGALLPDSPIPGSIVEEEQAAEIGVVRWRLSNGAMVVLKPTEFKNDEVLFAAQSPGGISLSDEADHIAATTATAVARESGVGAFDRFALEKRLSGVAVNVEPWAEMLQEGLSGSASPDDLETLLELVHLYITAPRFDSSAFSAYRDRMKGLFAHRGARPESAFADTVRVTLADYHVRERPWASELFDEMDLSASEDFYRDRFGDAGDFTFFFVGNVDTSALRPLAERYLASLPSEGRVETWRDAGIEAPRGVIHKEVRRGLEPKSRTHITFTGPFTWTRESRHAFNTMIAVLRLQLREVLREEMGGTYGATVSGTTSLFPDTTYRITLAFASDPERLDEMTGALFGEIDRLKTEGASAEHLAKVREMQRRSFESGLRQNRFWLGVLQRADFHGSDASVVHSYQDLVDSLPPDAVRDAARRHFDLENYVQISLVPAEGAQ